MHTQATTIKNLTERVDFLEAECLRLENELAFERSRRGSMDRSMQEPFISGDALLSSETATPERHLQVEAFSKCAQAIVIIDFSTKKIFACNQAFALMHGLEITDIEGKTIPDIYHPEEKERLVHYFTQMDVTPSFSIELELLRMDGLPLQLQIDVVSIFDSDGHSIHQVASLQDITERKKFEKKLHERETQFFAVVESAPEAIFIQTDGCYTYLNPSALALYGAKIADEMLGRPVLEHIHPDYRHLVSEEIRSVNTELVSPEPDEHLHLRCDGSSIPLEILAVPFFYEGRHGALVFARDSSGRKKAEAERLKLETALFRSQKMEAIGRLAGGVAHDMNNLLTPIIGYAEMLGIEPSTPETRLDTINMIIHAALKGRDLIRQLLVFNSKQMQQYALFDLNEVVRMFEPLLRLAVRENINISYRLFPASLTIYGDKVQIEQIVMNLAINAGDAMPQGGMLFIETAKVQIIDPEGDLHPGTWVQFVVSDTGSGIDTETMARIFEPFYTTKEQGKGTGLGLAIVYEIVRKHNGVIRVESAPEKGTTFRLYFPLQLPKEEVEVNEGRLSSSGARENKVVLVVEDNDMVRKFVVKTLKNNGYTTIEASGGEEALKRYHEYDGQPVMLLTDMVMDGMNGLELYYRVRSIAPDIKALFMSGYTADIIDDKGLFEKGIPLLQKPFTMKRLAEKVHEVFCG